MRFLGSVQRSMAGTGKATRYYTDGEIEISRLVAGCNAKAETAVELSNPPLVTVKNVAWKAIAEMFQTNKRAKRLTSK